MPSSASTVDGDGSDLSPIGWAEAVGDGSISFSRVPDAAAEKLEAFQEENRGFGMGCCEGGFSSAGVVGCDPARLPEGRVGSEGSEGFRFCLMSPSQLPRRVKGLAGAGRT